MRPAALDAHATKPMWWMLHFGAGDTFNLSSHALSDDNAGDLKASGSESGHQTCLGVPVRRQTCNRCVKNRRVLK